MSFDISQSTLENFENKVWCTENQILRDDLLYFCFVCLVHSYPLLSIKTSNCDENVNLFNQTTTVATISNSYRLYLFQNLEKSDTAKYQILPQTLINYFTNLKPLFINFRHSLAVQIFNEVNCYNIFEV